MPMSPLTLDQLTEIAEAHAVTYEQQTADSERAIATRMSRVFNVPQERLYETFANLEDHPRFLPHLRSVRAITSEDLGNVLQDNQVVIVEGLEEGGSRLGVKLFTLHPPDRIDGELITDPFSVIERSDPKRGTISWIFERVDDNSSRMTIESTFDPESNDFFNRGMVDHVWMDFFENAMVELGELPQEDRFTNLLGEPPERFQATFGR